MSRHRFFFAAAAALAFVAGAAAVVVLNAYMKTTDIMVAARDIDANVALSPNDVRIETVAARTVSRGILQSSQEVVGMVSNRPLPAGTPITAGYLAAPSSAGAAGRLLTYPGTVAVSLPANSDVTVGGTVKPGDRVTVYALYKTGVHAPPGHAASPSSKVVELAAAVPAIASPSDNLAAQNAAGVSHDVVLAVSPEQAHRIFEAQSAAAGIVCVLLPAKNEGG